MCSTSFYIDETFEQLGRVFFEISQRIDPEELLMVLHRLAAQTKPGSFAITTWTSETPTTDVWTERAPVGIAEAPPHPRQVAVPLRQEASTELVSIESALPEFFSHLEPHAWEEPIYHYITERVAARELPWNQALISQVAVNQPIPLAQRAVGQSDIPTLIRQLNEALRDPALEWCLPDGTQLQPQIVIELVPVIDVEVGQVQIGG